MSICGIDHVQLAMPKGQEEVARTFYIDLLQLAEIEKPPNLAKRGGCWFEHGQVKVHLGVDDNFRPAHKAHVAFLVDKLEALLCRLRNAGIDINENEPLEGYVRAFVNDPFGNRIEFMQRQPVSQ